MIRDASVAPVWLACRCTNVEITHLRWPGPAQWHRLIDAAADECLSEQSSDRYVTW